MLTKPLKKNKEQTWKLNQKRVFILYIVHNLKQKVMNFIFLCFMPKISLLQFHAVPAHTTPVFGSSYTFQLKALSSWAPSFYLYLTIFLAPFLQGSLRLLGVVVWETSHVGITVPMSLSFFIVSWCESLYLFPFCYSDDDWSKHSPWV